MCGSVWWEWEWEWEWEWPGLHVVPLHCGRHNAFTLTHSLTVWQSLTPASQSTTSLSLTHSLTLNQFVHCHSHSLTHTHSLTHSLSSFTHSLPHCESVHSLSAVGGVLTSLVSPLRPHSLPTLFTAIPLSSFCLLPSAFVVRCLCVVVCVLVGVVGCCCVPSSSAAL